MESNYDEVMKPQKGLIQIIQFQFFPYWPILVLLLLLFFVGGYFFIRFTPKEYRSTASLLIKDEKKGVDNSQMIQSLNIYASKKIVENEIEVIKSKKLLLETIKQLKLYAPVFTINIFGESSAYSESPVIIEVQDLNNIKAVSDIPIIVADDSVYLNNLTYPINEWIETKYGTIKFLNNENALHPDIDQIFYFSLVKPAVLVEELNSRIEVTPISKLSTVVNISILDEIPKRGQDIINTLISKYTQASLEDKNLLAKNTMVFIQERLTSVERELDSVEAKIQQYKSSKGVVDLGEQGKLYLQNVGQNDRKISEFKLQLAVLDKVEDYVVSNNNRGGLVPSTMGIADPGLNSLIQKLYELEIKYDRLSKTTPSHNLIMVSLKKEIDQIRPSIIENLNNQRQSLNAGLETINQSTKNYTSVLGSIPRKERELLEINRQQLIKNNVYTFLLQKREETALSYASNVGDSRIIDKATTAFHPESPKNKVVYFSCFSFAVFVFVGWVSFKEKFNSKVLFRSEIENRTNVPIRGEISYSGLKDLIVVNHPKKRFLTDQFSQIRASLGLYGKSRNKIIMISSSISGEGKSFICANLAMSLSNSGKRVLLVDMDFRNPTLTRFFGLTDDYGISEVISGELSISDFLERNNNDKPLYIMGTGKKLSNPTDAFLNEKIEEIIDEAKNIFDYVIIDTAPIGSVADGYVINKYCDLCFLVVRHGKTPKRVIESLAENEDFKELKNKFILFNGVKMRGVLINSVQYGYGTNLKYYHQGK